MIFRAVEEPPVGQNESGKAYRCEEEEADEIRIEEEQAKPERRQQPERPPRPPLLKGIRMMIKANISKPTQLIPHAPITE